MLEVLSETAELSGVLSGVMSELKTVVEQTCILTYDKTSLNVNYGKSGINPLYTE